MTGSHVVITGGSSGIGAAIAALYLARGAPITLIARNEGGLRAQRESLLQLPPSVPLPGSVHIEAVDVRDASALGAAIARSEVALGPCARLVVAAGVVKPGPFHAMSDLEQAAQIDTNLVGAMNAVRAVYTGMRERRVGRVLLVGSAAGLVGLYGYTAYCASKSGLLGFAEALRQEARCDGIRVSICLPPDTDTPQLTAELPLRPAEASAAIGRASVQSAEFVAQRAVEGFEAGRFLICPTQQVALLARFGSLFAPTLRRLFDRRIDAIRRQSR